MVSIKKIKLDFKKYGVKKLTTRFFPFIFSYSPLNFYCISHKPGNRFHAKCPLAIRRGGRQDIDAIINLFDYLHPEIVSQQVEYLFNTGGKLFLAFSQGALAHVARVRYHPGIFELDHPERDPYIEIDEDDVYIGHCETSKLFTGKSIYTAVLQHIIDYELNNGKKRCFITASPRNKASIRVIDKLGFNFVVQKNIFRIFGIKFNYKWSSLELLY